MTQEFEISDEHVDKLVDIRMELFEIDEVQDPDEVLEKAVEIAHKEVAD